MFLIEMNSFVTILHQYGNSQTRYYANETSSSQKTFHVDATFELVDVTFLIV